MARRLLLKDVEIDGWSTWLQDEKKQFYVKEFLSKSMVVIPVPNDHIIYKDIKEYEHYEPQEENGEESMEAPMSEENEDDLVEELPSEDNKGSLTTISRPPCYGYLSECNF
ncbi:hypothetical protein FNV43_RR00507 [Rhamnella rubrinervis]|uniref:Uncharacterized protein n=1 Tax=Rhamnella rubrinervis TaxID=2594499 RepID=A0A8K0HQI5_9ROSA|nr:hypothetical protein FNV43_RR00507 [Rhamnella rubrinervis]